MERGADINASSHRGYTPLIMATWGGHHDVISTLLLHHHHRQHLAIDAQDKRGETAVFKAAFNGDSEILKLLLEVGGADPTLGRHDDGQTPLDQARDYRQNECIQVLQVRKARRGMTDIYVRHSPSSLFPFFCLPLFSLSLYRYKHLGRDR